MDILISDRDALAVAVERLVGKSSVREVARRIGVNYTVLYALKAKSRAAVSRRTAERLVAEENAGIREQIEEALFGDTRRRMLRHYLSWLRSELLAYGLATQLSLDQLAGLVPDPRQGSRLSLNPAANDRQRWIDMMRGMLEEDPDASGTGRILRGFRSSYRQWWRERGIELEERLALAECRAVSTFGSWRTPVAWSDPRVPPNFVSFTANPKGTHFDGIAMALRNFGDLPRALKAALEAQRLIDAALERAAAQNFPALFHLGRELLPPFPLTAQAAGKARTRNRGSGRQS